MTRENLSKEARVWVTEGALLLDVRTVEEFGAGHIGGAVNIPVQELDGRIAELGPQSRSVVVYCKAGARSAAAEQIMRRAGFTRVLDLGAMSNW